MKHRARIPFRGAGRIPGGSSGFTLTELIVVVAVISIISAIAIPGYSVWVPRYQLKQASRDLYSNIQLMKMVAVKNNTSANLLFSTGQYQYEYALSGVTQTKTFLLNDYGSGVKFESAGGSDTFNSSTVTLDARGFFTPPTGFAGTEFRAYLSNAASTDYYCVSLSTTGALKLLKHDGTAYN